MAEIDRALASLNEALEKLLTQAQAAADRAGGVQDEAEALRAKEALAVAAAADHRAAAAALAAENSQIAQRKTAVETETASFSARLEEAE